MELGLKMKEIIQAVKKKCPIDQLSAVVVCLRWDTRIDESHRKVLQLVNEISDGIFG